MKRILAILGLGLAGVFSGILTYGLLEAQGIVKLGALGIFYTPGVVFGIVVGYFLLRFQKRYNFSNLLLFAALSAGSYYAAINASIFTMLLHLHPFFQSMGVYFALLVSGFAGSLTLLFTYNLIVAKLNFKTNVMLLFLGTILSLFYFISPPYFPTSANKNNIIALWVFWHAGMAMGFGWATVQAPQAKSNKKK